MIDDINAAERATRDVGAQMWAEILCVGGISRAQRRALHEIRAIVNEFMTEMWTAGAQSVPTLDDADMLWLIARSMSTWSEDYYASAWLADLEGAITAAASGRVVTRADAAYEARRLVRLVETLGIEWPTEADLETSPESGAT